MLDILRSVCDPIELYKISWFVIRMFFTSNLSLLVTHRHAHTRLRVRPDGIVKENVKISNKFILLWSDVRRGQTPATTTTSTGLIR